MKDSEIRPQNYDQSQHFQLKEQAFQYFYAESQDQVEAEKMSNIVFNVKVLKSSYSPSIQAKVDKFLLKISEEG